MKIAMEEIPLNERTSKLKEWLAEPHRRLGHITSIDGNQLITLVLDTKNNSAHIWKTDLHGNSYGSITPSIPQGHWLERTLWDMFGLFPQGHPRLKHNLLHEPYPADFLPLTDSVAKETSPQHRNYHPMPVEGDGIFEIPVGPIHAGIIEPGHFRFSCLGEIIFNLEIRLGYVHRGVEKRLTEIPWKNQRFVAEAAATDTVAANALANSIVLESLLDVEITPKANFIRSISLEIERIAMHLADLGGLAGDIGFLAVSTSFARLRGNALRLGELMAGTRFQRAFICPGGVVSDPTSRLKEIQKLSRILKKEIDSVVDFFLNNQGTRDRMENIGKVSHKLAGDFGLVGIAGRASGIVYDARQHFAHGAYDEIKTQIAVETGGDVLSRAKVRVRELDYSLQMIDELIEKMPTGEILVSVPEKLRANKIGLAIVEAHRGELIHLAFTDGEGAINRYAIKDPSVNNWTGLAIAVRKNLVADFPLCNKSFSLSYSGHDL